MKELDLIKKYISGMVTFSEEEMDFFTSRMSIRDYKKGSYLLEESKTAQAIWFINKGLTRNITRLPDGSELTQFFSMENSFITEYASFLKNTPAIYSIQCLEQSEIIEIPKSSITEGYARIKEGNKLGRLIAENYFTQFVKAAHDRQTMTLFQQYQSIEDYFPGLHQRVPQRMIASYLGISPVHLSRLKSQAIGNS